MKPDRPPAVWVHWYLIDVSPAVSHLFDALLEVLCGDSEKVQRIKELRKQMLFSLIAAYGDVGGG
jgi:hypothetical protein